MDAMDYDVAVMGGSIAGTATALMLLQEKIDGRPLRVLVIERAETLGRRVGESTVELSTYFLTRVLGLTRHLNENHIVKQGFRYWFTNGSAKCMGCCTEMGGRYLSRVGSYQVDRQTLDAEVMRRVEAMGGEVWRPASVRSVELEAGGMQTLSVKMDDGQTRTVRARWVVDATGRQAMLARKRGEVRPIEDHPTAAVWARWRGTMDFDGWDLVQKVPGLREGFCGTRHTATNHLMGDGWWAWVIPLKNGDTSIGITWDQRYFDWPRDQGGSLGEQLRSVLETHPVGREVIRDAEMVEGDVHVRRNLPYVSETFMGDGFAQVGDAAAFIDPFYSMGLDSLAISATAAVDVIQAERRGMCIKMKLERHNQMLATTFDRWYRALFRGKYAYIGDFELMRIAFLIDVGLYYFGIVFPPYRNGRREMLDGMFYPKVSLPFYGLMKLMNVRLAALGRDRRRRGVFGRRNVGRRMLVPGFAFDVSILRAVVKALLAWLKLEVTEGWRGVLHRGEASGRSAKPMPPAMPSGAMKPSPEVVSAGA